MDELLWRKAVPSFPIDDSGVCLGTAFEDAEILNCKPHVLAMDVGGICGLSGAEVETAADGVYLGTSWPRQYP